MKKSYKQQTLDAQLDLIERYKKNDPPKACPFCAMYMPHKQNPATFEDLKYCRRGCFMAGPKDKLYEHCQRFESFINSKLMDLENPEKRLRRARFHQRVRKILLKRPARYFTPSGWKYLDIPKEW